MSEHAEILPAERSVFERPITIKIVWALLIGGCLVSAALGFWYASKGKLVYEPHFEDKEGALAPLAWLADHFPAFYALVGFVSFAFIVLAGQHLRRILMRPEGYYDGAEAEAHNPVAEPVVRVDDMDVGPAEGSAEGHADGEGTTRRV